MPTLTAKVFQAGNSKALRLPRGLKVKAKSYQVTPTATGFIATDAATDAVTAATRWKMLKSLRGSAPDFPDHGT